VLDLAIQEGVANYLKSHDISPLRHFLETAAKFLVSDNVNKLKPPSITNTAFSPTELPVAMMVDALCDVYGFMGDFDAAWRICVRSGLDSDYQRYLTFGVHCDWRKFTARQAYYFPAFRPPVTAAGRTYKMEIYPLVEEKLGTFEAIERNNLFDYYISISGVITKSCSQVPGLETYSEPNGEDVFERGHIQNGILSDFRQRFETVVQPFENRLKDVFADPEEFTKSKHAVIERLKTELVYPLHRKRQFLYRHFYDVGSRDGLGGSSKIIRRVFKDGNHQLELPLIQPLIMECMSRHIAKLFRECEDRFRQSLGLRGVGQGWVSEATLFALLKNAFSDQVVLQHARPKWIGRQHLDIYFPQMNVAVEYQGVQHERAVSIFGGEAALSVRKRMDKKKKEACRANGCRLIEVFPGDPMERVVEEVKKCAAKTQSAFTPILPNEIEVVAGTRETPLAVC
jgi:hypothetical protein